MAEAGPYRYWAAPHLDRNWQAALGKEFEAVGETQAELKILDRWEILPPGQAALLVTDDPLPGVEADGDFAVAPALATPDVLRTIARLLVERLRWEQAAHTDALTGLPNRRAWERALRQAEASPLCAWAMAILDLDQFKRVNEATGYAAGDRLLASVAACWREHLRPGWVLARIGGDEFAMLLPLDQSESVDVLRRLVSTAAPSLTASAGCATTQPGGDLAAVFDRADAALRQAKRGGGNQTVSGSQVG